MKDNERKKFDLSNDILSLRLLESFIPKKSYLPYTSSSLSFESIRIIANDIVVNNRHHVLEFGSGISTIILGSLLQTLGNNTSLISIDENKDWVDLLNNILKSENIKTVQIIHQELNLSTKAKYQYWYEPEGLKSKIEMKSSLIIVDGPSAWQKERAFARKPALDFILYNDLIDLDNFSLYLDDCNRKAEKESIEEWAVKLRSQPRFLTKSLGRISKNDMFNIL